MISDLLVIGAGYVGEAVAAFYAAKGLEVAGMVRSQASADRLASHGIFPVLADLTQPASLSDLPFAKKILICPSASERTEEEYGKIYIEGVYSFLKTLKDKRSEKIIYISSTGVYGSRDGEWVEEDMLPDPDNPLGKILLDAEKQVINSGFPVIIFRLSGIYGPGRNRIELDREVKADRYANMMHIDDIVGAIALLFEKGQIGEIYIGADEEPVLISELYRHLGKDTSGLVRDDRLLGKRCRNTKLKKIGFTFKYPTFREGYKELKEKL